MTFLCDTISYVAILLFGTAVSFCFAGITAEKKNVLSLLLFCTLELILQITILRCFGKEWMRQLYPVITHFPLIFFLVLVHKCKWLNAAISVLSAYLCCRIPWWFCHFFKLFFREKIIYTAAYVIVACLTFAGIYKYIAKPTEHFINHSKKSALLIGTVPLFYYCFDYTAAVYTNRLYSGSRALIQFIPTMVSFVYFLFIVIYYRELSLKEEVRHQAETLTLQLQHAAATLDNMRQLQENTITYRHDMRHHLGYIQTLASSGNLENLQKYICTIQSDIEAVTPKKFCQNEVINLILSTYDLKSKKNGVSFDVHADVPDNISISDTNLCALLSNALENALNAAKKTTGKTISVHLTVRSSSLLIQISNPFYGEARFQNNLPVSPNENHGFGTKSIAAIVDSYNGQYEFSAEDNLFTLRILLPL